MSLNSEKNSAFAPSFENLWKNLKSFDSKWLRACLFNTEPTKF
jgi:hypothetical protein